MSKYSEFFLLGSPEYVNIGEKLRLRKYGSWLAEETWFREEQSKKRAQFTLQAIYLARKIALKKGISEEEAFELLQSEQGDVLGVYGEFAEDASRLMDIAPSAKDQFEKLATLFFKNRGEVLIGKKWQATEDWSAEDTRKLTEEMIGAVQGFMASEETVNDQEDDQEEESDPK